MKSAILRRLLLVCVMTIPIFGCAGAVVPVAVWLGKVVLYTAAVRATTQLVDQVLGQRSQQVNNDVVPNQGDPNRGLLRSLTVGKKNSDGTASPSGSVTFTDVPVVRSTDGRWIVEKFYADTVIEPQLRAVN